MRISYPPPSVSAPFYRYSKLQLHGTEESQNRRRLNDGDQTYDPIAQKAARQPTELRLLHGGETREEGGMERIRENKTAGKTKDRCKMKGVYKGANNFMNINDRKALV